MSIEDSPEFKAALSEECERQYRGYLYGGNIPKGKIGSTAEEIQAQRREIEGKVAEAKAHAERIREETRIASDPTLREITENLRRIHSTESNLVCPQCGETNSHGNWFNGKPACMKCQLQMVSREKAEKWVKPTPPKRFSRGFDEPKGVVRFRK